MRSRAVVALSGVALLLSLLISLHPQLAGGNAAQDSAASDPPAAPGKDELQLTLSSPFRGVIEATTPRLPLSKEMQQRVNRVDVRGVRLHLVVTDGGSYTIELRSFEFDTFLAIRKANDADGNSVLQEADDGWISSQSRVVCELSAGEVYWVDACSIADSEFGPFELTLRKGEPSGETPQLLREASIADLRKSIDVVEKKHGSADKRLPLRMRYLAYLLRGFGREEEAEVVLKKLVETSKKIHGPRHPEVAFDIQTRAAVVEELGRVDEAEQLLREALSIRSERFGKEHPQYGETLTFLAGFLKRRGKFTEAEELQRQGIALFEKTFPATHPNIAINLNFLGEICSAQGKFKEAEELHRRALKICEASLGVKARRTSDTLQFLGRVVDELGRFAEAEAIHRKALAIRVEVLGKDHPDVAVSMHDIASTLIERGKYTDALQQQREALAIMERAYGPEHPQVAAQLNTLCGVLQYLSRYAEAEPLQRRALKIIGERYGESSRQYATFSHNLGNILAQLARFEEAEQCLQRGLELRQKILGAEHASVGTSYNDLSSVYADRGKYREAEAAARRAVAIREKVYGPDHPRVAVSLGRLAYSLERLGRYDEAIAQRKRQIAIEEKTLEPGHPRLGRSYGGFGMALTRMGRYGEAERYHRKSIAIVEKSLGEDHAGTATEVAALSVVLKRLGRFEDAEKCSRRALAIRERVHGPDHPDVAAALNDLAILVGHRGALTEASALHDRALRIRRSVFGDGHTQVAQSLNNLSLVRRKQGRLDEALLLQKESQSLIAAKFGPEHPHTGVSLENYGQLLERAGKLAKADIAYSQAIAIYEKSLGANHPYVHMAQRFRSGALTAWADAMDAGEQATKLRAQAWQLIVQAFGARQQHISQELLGASQEEALDLAWTQRSSLQQLLSMPQARSGEGVGRAFELASAWKGKGYRHALERSQLGRTLEGEGRAALQRLRVVKTELSKLAYEADVADPQEHSQKFEGLRKEKDELERTVARHMKLETTESQVTVADVTAALPKKSVLIDLYIHDPFRFQRWEFAPKTGEFARAQATPATLEPQVIAFVVRPGAKGVVRVELGPADKLQAATEGYLENLVARRGLTLEETGPTPNDKLRALLWEPLAPHVGDAEQVFVAPDTFLARLPFGTLQRADKSFLIEHHSFVSVMGAASLVATLRRAPADRSEPGALLAVGGVDYDERAESADEIAATPGSGQDRMRGGFDTYWAPLAATRGEAAGVLGLHRKHTSDETPRMLLAGSEATEEKIGESINKARVLHLATHGFFEPIGVPSLWEQMRAQRKGGGNRRGADPGPVPSGQLPGLLSGLVFAGANEPSGGGHVDGYLTAEEVTGFDLARCDLVVLSACETGVGTERGGEGMLSLRRAFHEAGARTVISSLWSVRDDSTRKLMIEFYQRLWRDKLPPAQALRQAQLFLLERNRARGRGEPLPSTWGAFQLSGDGR